MKLQELFDKPLPWKWHEKRKDFWDAMFDVDGKEGYIDFKQEHPGEWSIAFAIDSDEEVSGEGDEFKVFATVIDIIKNFIKIHKPKRLEFTAKENSRIKLYNKFVKVIGSKLGYKAKRSKYGDYILVRK